MPRTSPSLEVIDEITALYNAGETIRSLSKKYDKGYAWIRRRVLFKRPQGNRLKYSLDVAVFDTRTPESAYWIGFLLADGCVTAPKRGQNMITVGLKTSDAAHLEKFKKFLKADYPVRLYDQVAMFRFPSNYVVNALSEYGVVPRKSLVADVSQDLINNRDFWRGMIDGDGCLSTNQYRNNPKYCRVTITGSRLVCENFVSFVNYNFNYVMSVRKYNHANCYATVVTKDSVSRSLAKLLYNNAIVSLDRKLQIAESW